MVLRNVTLAFAALLAAAPLAHAAHSTCAGAEGVHPMFLFPCGDTSATDANGGATDVYDGSSCTGGDSSGLDVVWYADMEPGYLLTVTMTPSDQVDAVVYIVSDCGDVAGSCVAGSDVAGIGGSETVSYESSSTDRYYVIFDGNVGGQGAPGGDFAVTANLRCEPPVPSDEVSWGRVKSVFREEG